MRDLRSRDLRHLNGFARAASTSSDLSSLIDLFKERAARLLPSEFVCWNVFTDNFQQFAGIHGTPAFHETADKLRGEFLATLHTHPLTLWLSDRPEKTLELATSQSIVVSDLKQPFVETAVYQEVYQHLSTRDQLTCGLGYSATGNEAYIIGFNRTRQGFTSRERQLAEAMAILLKDCLPLIERLESTNAYLAQLRLLVARPVDSLTPKEVEILQHLLAGNSQAQVAAELGVNGSVLRRRVSVIREKLHYNSTTRMLYDLRSRIAAIGQ